MHRNKSECPKCNQEISKSNFNRHVNSCDGKLSKPTECPHCGGNFKRLSMHIKLKHEKKWNPNDGYAKNRQAWNKGLTKETSDDVRRITETLKMGYESGAINSPMKGKKHSEESKKRMSLGMLRRSAEGRNPGWFHINSDPNRRSRPERYFLDSLRRLDYSFDVVEKMPFGKFFLDFAIPSMCVDIEIDGSQHFRSPEAIQYDDSRNKFLIESGWHVIRITAKDVLRNSDEAVKSIFGYINNLPVSPQVANLSKE